MYITENIRSIYIKIYVGNMNVSNLSVYLRTKSSLSLVCTNNPWKCPNYVCIRIYDFHMNLFQIPRNIFSGITENELIKTTVSARLLSKGRGNTLTVLVVDRGCGCGCGCGFGGYLRVRMELRVSCRQQLQVQLCKTKTPIANNLNMCEMVKKQGG